MRTRREAATPELGGALSLALALLLAGAGVARSAELYAVSWNTSEIYTIDLGTGAATLVGPTTLIDLDGIAFDDAGVLYAMDASTSSMELNILDPVAGTATLVGAAGFGGGEGALVYDPVDEVFYSKANLPGEGAGGLGLNLVTIDPGTGLGTIIGNMGLNQEADVSGMALLPDGTLIAYDPQSAMTDRLLSIDKLTGVATVIGPTADATLNSLGGLAVDPDTGTVYLSDNSSLFSVDPGTGAATLIGAHGVIVTGLSFEPDVVCMLGLDMDSRLYDVSPDDGAGSNLRVTGVDNLGGLALSPGGTLYALRDAASGELYTLDIATGAATLVGATGIAVREGALDFDPVSGNLYGANGDTSGAFYTLDTGTGAATLLGTIVDEFAQPIDVSALAFDAAGTLYALKTTTAPEIYRIDPADGSVFARVPIPGFAAGPDLGGMEFDDSTGLLYATISGQFVTLNPTTGATTPLGISPARSALEITGACGGTPPGPKVPVTGLWGWALLVLGLLAAGGSVAIRTQRTQS